MALINNPYLTEEAAVLGAALDASSDKGRFQKRADGKRNLCSMPGCTNKTYFICTVCSTPKSHKARTYVKPRGKGGNLPAGTEPGFITGYVHVCSKGTCYSDHACSEPGIHPSSHRKRQRGPGAGSGSDAGM